MIFLIVDQLNFIFICFFLVNELTSKQVDKLLAKNIRINSCDPCSNIIKERGVTEKGRVRLQAAFTEVKNEE